MYPTHAAYFRNYIRTDNGFSNSCTHTTTSTLTIAYWYAALISIWNIKIVKLSKLNKYISHVYLPVHSIIWLVPIVSCCFKFSAFGLNTKKNYWWYIEFVKFNLMVHRNELQNPWYRLSTVVIALDVQYPYKWALTSGSNGGCNQDPGSNIMLVLKISIERILLFP